MAGSDSATTVSCPLQQEGWPESTFRFADHGATQVPPIGSVVRPCWTIQRFSSATDLNARTDIGARGSREGMHLNMYRFPGMGMGTVVGAGTAGGLATTGFDYTWWIFVGLVLIVAGAFLFRVVQRHGRNAE